MDHTTHTQDTAPQVGVGSTAGPATNGETCGADPIHHGDVGVASLQIVLRKCRALAEGGAIQNRDILVQEIDALLAHSSTGADSQGVPSLSVPSAEAGESVPSHASSAPSSTVAIRHTIAYLDASKGTRVGVRFEDDTELDLPIHDFLAWVKKNVGGR